MTFMMKKKKYKFSVTLTVEELSSVPFINSVLFVKCRLLEGGTFEDVTDRREVENHCVKWNKCFMFTCKTTANASTGILDPCTLRLSLRKETKGGKSYVKLGYYDLNLASCAGAGLTSCRCLLEGYDSRHHRQDNSILLVTVDIKLLAGDPCFKTPKATCLTVSQKQGSLDALLDSDIDPPKNKMEERRADTLHTMEGIGVGIGGTVIGVNGDHHNLHHHHHHLPHLPLHHQTIHHNSRSSHNQTPAAQQQQQQPQQTTPSPTQSSATSTTTSSSGTAIAPSSSTLQQQPQQHNHHSNNLVNASATLSNNNNSHTSSNIFYHFDQMTSSATSNTNSVGSTFDPFETTNTNTGHSRSNSSQTSSSRISTGYNSLPSHSRQGSADSESTTNIRHHPSSEIKFNSVDRVGNKRGGGHERAAKPANGGTGEELYVSGKKAMDSTRVSADQLVQELLQSNRLMESALEEPVLLSESNGGLELYVGRDGSATIGSRISRPDDGSASGAAYALRTSSTKTAPSSRKLNRV